MTDTVLTVDDEQDLLFLVRSLLEQAGYCVLEASGGKQALALLADENPDVCLLDLHMPGVDGWQVLEELKARGRLASLPVIVLSAHADPRAVTRSIEFGAKGYVKKPFKGEDLTRAIEDVLS